MTVHPIRSEAKTRGARILRTALGPSIAAWLDDAAVIEVMLPPIVSAPAFAIRKPAVAVFTLDDYVTAGIMSSAQADPLRQAVPAHANILVAGGTGSGKTTLVNALLAEVAKTANRIVLIEDTRELQCAAPNLVAMRTKDGVVSLSDLVRSSLRLRPDRTRWSSVPQARTSRCCSR